MPEEGKKPAAAKPEGGKAMGMTAFQLTGLLSLSKKADVGEKPGITSESFAQPSQPKKKAADKPKRPKPEAKAAPAVAPAAAPAEAPEVAPAPAPTPAEPWPLASESEPPAFAVPTGPRYSLAEEPPPPKTVGDIAGDELWESVVETEPAPAEAVTATEEVAEEPAPEAAAPVPEPVAEALPEAAAEGAEDAAEADEAERCARRAAREEAVAAQPLTALQAAEQRALEFMKVRESKAAVRPFWLPPEERHTVAIDDQPVYMQRPRRRDAGEVVAAFGASFISEIERAEQKALDDLQAMRGGAHTGGQPAAAPAAPKVTVSDFIAGLNAPVMAPPAPQPEEEAPPEPAPELVATTPVPDAAPPARGDPMAAREEPEPEPEPELPPQPEAEAEPEPLEPAERRRVPSWDEAEAMFAAELGLDKLPLRPRNKPQPRPQPFDRSQPLPRPRPAAPPPAETEEVAFEAEEMCDAGTETPPASSHEVPPPPRPAAATEPANEPDAGAAGPQEPRKFKIKRKL